MPNSETALEALKRIQQDFAEFCEAHGKVTEADTRAQVIDRILEQVCGWPTVAIERERYVRREDIDKKSKSFVDYGLNVGDRPILLLEAKREGITFELPHDLGTRTPKLSGTLLNDIGPVREAILQVRNYCDDLGIKFAIATNGYCWIIFRAVREDIPWHQGHARVFASLEQIEQQFTDFWNLLSYSAIASGSLSEEFGTPIRSSRELHRVSNKLFNADLPLARNRLHGQLGPIVKTFFDDIGDLDQVKVLQDCYVHSGSLATVADDLNLIIKDTVPKLLKEQGTKEIVQDLHGTGEWGKDFATAISSSKGELFLLLGGIGSGKTTFLRRYQRTVGSVILKDYTLWFHISFLGPPIDPASVEKFICESILEQLRTRYADFKLERREFLKIVFHGKIQGISETLLGGLKPGTQEYEKALSPSLAKWQEDVVDYVPRLLKAAKDFVGRSVVLFVDNVDQLTPNYQQQIFVVAQGMTKAIGSVTVVALREESYYTANTQKTFAAYATRKFHIASPRFKKLIGSRIQLALQVLADKESQVKIPTTIEMDRRSIVDFLNIVEYSIFVHNVNIARFIEALCFGNMRKALEWFSTFLTSGATDVDKMLSIYRRDGQYYVPYHEFVKSIMLLERVYYRDDASPILNLFDCGSEKNSSHFTSLRILSLLLDHQNDDSPEGRGYFELSKLEMAFEDVFRNRDDFIHTAERMVKKGLIEVNTRSTETIVGASHVRATSAGWYYDRYLVYSFAYLDLVLQDTPLNDSAIEQVLRESVHRVGNLSDREDKVARTEARFTRVSTFLDYLYKEELSERNEFGLDKIKGSIGKNWVPSIRAEFEKQRDWIRIRIKENREKFADDINFGRAANNDEAFAKISDLISADEVTLKADNRIKSLQKAADRTNKIIKPPKK